MQGKELQETGLYSYGWRDYMPDIGRWNGIDQLAESYLSTSPYAYVANNPVSQFDVDGRWMDDNGHIDTSGNANPFRDMAQSQMRMTQFMGRNPGEGGAGGYLAFGHTQAYTDLMTAFFNKGEVGISNHGGALRWWTSIPDSYDEEGNLVKGVGALGMLMFKGNTTTDWYGLAGKGNWFFGTAGILSGTAGVIDSHNMYSQGIRRGLSGNYQLTGRNLSQFGKMAMTDATKPVSNFARTARFVGHFSFGIGVISDIGGMATGQVSLGKALINTGFGALGNWGGSIGSSLSTVYFGVDSFYPGGWPGMFNDSNFVQGKLDQGFNQAGPYRINVFGAHEPK